MSKVYCLSIIGLTDFHMDTLRFRIPLFGYPGQTVRIVEAYLGLLSKIYRLLYRIRTQIFKDSIAYAIVRDAMQLLLHALDIEGGIMAVFHIQNHRVF